MDIWQIAYQLCGVTLLGKTKQELLGALPLPVRSAILCTAQEFAPSAISVEWSKQESETSSLFPHKYINWEIEDEHLEKLVNTPAPFSYLPKVQFSSIDAFFQHHKLFKLQEDGTDEHFAERRFVEEVFVPVVGLNALTFLCPQEKFSHSNGVERRIDFVIEGATKYAIEIEGYTYHGQSQQFDGEKERQRELVEAGYSYFPFSYTDIVSGKARCNLEELVKDDPQLAAKCDSANTSQVTLVENTLLILLKWFPEKYQTYQKIVLWQLWQATISGKKVLRFAEPTPHLPIFAIALLDTLSVLEHTFKLYDLPLSLPKIDFFRIGESGICHDSLWHNYYDRSVWQKNAPVHPVHFQTIVLGDGTQLSNITLELQLDYCIPDYLSEIKANPLQEERSSQDLLQSQMSPFLRHVTGLQPFSAVFTHCDDSAINFFARRYFRVERLKVEQQQLLERALRGESGLGILPTGFGKSLVFQLYALLVPCVTLVISPLRSLMRDQVHELRELGLTSVAFISAEDSASEKTQKLKSTFGNRLRLLYVAPERLQIKAFVDEMTVNIKNSPIRTLVVDEAHCVSEWGHDFRPAYLQIRHLRQRIEEMVQRPLTIIALTATASETVRKDIAQILVLDDRQTVQLASSDRRNLSLSVHSAEQTLTAKHDVMKHLIQAIIPTALGKDARLLLSPNENNKNYSSSGLIFATYAKPAGSTNFEEGVHTIADYLSREVVFDPTLVKVFASGAPKVCPACNSALLISHTERKTNQKFFTCKNRDCPEKGKPFLFDNAQDFKNWEETARDAQDNFKRNAFPLLVATKGYGMGVNKGNIRFVIHHGLPSGLESYFQEAGRAGRDGKHAHVALIYRPPTAGCRQEYLQQDKMPPCTKEYARCEFGLRGLCDIGHQMRFHAKSFPGIKEDYKIVENTYEKLTECSRFMVNGDESKVQTERGLHRLQQLGIISDYSLDYKGRNIEFLVKLQDWNATTVYDHLREYLLGTRMDAEVVQSKIVELQQWADEDIAKLVQGATKILIRRFYEAIPPMRYQMLMSLLRYADTNLNAHKQQVCRRVSLLAALDGTLVSDDVRCGFCDVCQPNYSLDGISGSQINAWVMQQQQHLSTMLVTVLKGFDIQSLQQMIDSAIRLHTIHALLARIEQTLENDALNIAALFLSGALYCYQGREDQGMMRLERAWNEGLVQKLLALQLRLIYETARQYQPSRAFYWANQINGPFDTLDGLAFLTSEAGQIYGADSQNYISLSNLFNVRLWQTVQITLAEMSPILTQIQANFDKSSSELN